MLSILLSTVPATVEWNTNVAIVMIACNLFAIVVGRFAIRNPGQGPDLPFSKPALWNNFGVPELLATTSLGHVLGAGLILGLANAGVL
ncbi:MAG: photosystem I reaction center subunit PsaK [Spirulina sp. SIO3F2]|nr:photosystem I reaction center subunit PsaK [Spirulina sp. SIO3F2]